MERVKVYGDIGDLFLADIGPIEQDEDHGWLVPDTKADELCGAFGLSRDPAKAGPAGGRLLAKRAAAEAAAKAKAEEDATAKAEVKAEVAYQPRSKRKPVPEE